MSKVDPTALGAVRSLSCACPAVLCPVRLLQQVLGVGAAVLGTSASDDAPLVVTSQGAPVSKAGVVRCLRGLVERCGGDPAAVSGHSPRVSGARFFAAAGSPVWLIQIHGRWGSDAVLRYVQEAALGTCGQAMASGAPHASTAGASAKDLLAVKQLLANIIKDAAVPDGF